MIWAWWEKFKELASLYPKGMTNSFVKGYFEDDCDLKIWRQSEMPKDEEGK